jgi:hypothetical protein
VVRDAYLRIKNKEVSSGQFCICTYNVNSEKHKQQRGKFADVDKELLMSTYQFQKLKKALLSTTMTSMKMKGWKDKTMRFKKSRINGTINVRHLPLPPSIIRSAIDLHRSPFLNHLLHFNYIFHPSISISNISNHDQIHLHRRHGPHGRHQHHRFLPFLTSHHPHLPTPQYGSNRRCK